MIKGMTGYGSAPFKNDQVKGVLEVKSVNHRYFDISFYLPIGFGSVENKIKSAVNKKISRGKVTVSLKIADKPASTPSFNKEAVQKYLKQSRSLKRQFGLKNDLTLADLAKLPGVVEVKETSLNVEALWPAIEKALCVCLNGLIKMRTTEGRSSATDIRSKATKMTGELKKIKKRAAVIFKTKKKQLTDEEYAAFCRNDDINEEISRLGHYIDEMKLLLNSSSSVGKKMDFIAQEMQRETNTIGSKLQDKVISNAVIALKGKIEKIREQSQNVE